MSNRIALAWDKLLFCYRICADIPSFIRLTMAAKVFSGSRDRYMEDRHEQYRMNIGGRKTRLILRRFAGDLDIFFEVFWKKTYVIKDIEKSEVSSVLDLGANTGMSAAYFYTAFPNAAFYCVEPDAENFRIMEINLKGLIPGDRLHLLQAAVGDQDSKGELVSSRYAYNKRVIAQNKGEVSILSMASILDNFQLSNVDLVKMDVEGAEQMALKDAGWLIKVRYIFIEFHSEDSLNNGVAVLSSKGFTWKKCAGNEMLVFAENTIF